jgi:hypothetical protein
MGASLGVGKNLRLTPPGTDGGSLALVGSPLSWTNMSWSSIAELRKVAEEQLDIPPDDWPFYDGVELEEDLPLEDALTKCQQLRTRLAKIPPEALPENEWLRDLARLLREGWDFCATAI